MRTHYNQDQGPELPELDGLTQIMREIQKRIENEEFDSINNFDPEIRMLIGTGEWRERAEVVDANLRLNELLIAIYKISSAWTEVSLSTIKNCFNLAGFKDGELEEEPDDLETFDMTELRILWP